MFFDCEDVLTASLQNLIYTGWVW